MVSGGSARLDPALLSAFPKPFNFKVDIYTPGKVDRYMAALRHALSSRKMLQHLAGGDEVHGGKHAMHTERCTRGGVDDVCWRRTTRRMSEVL